MEQSMFGEFPEKELKNERELINYPRMMGKATIMQLERGMRLNVLGSIYKVIAVRPNGKVTLKFEK